MEGALFVVKSKFCKSIRLTRKIWFDKILHEHPEFSLEQELLALRWCETAPNNPKYLCVVYREYDNEGFIITAFFISKYGKLLRRNIKWPKQIL